MENKTGEVVDREGLKSDTRKRERVIEGGILELGEGGQIEMRSKRGTTSSETNISEVGKTSHEWS